MRLLTTGLLPLACAAALGLTTLSAHAAKPASKVPGSDAIASKTLANGLKIVVWPDHDIPNASYYTFYKVGSRNEYPGITGLAHYFEHMMFNGTSRRAPGEFDRIMEAAGGSNNASTSNDLTIYTDWFPTSALETIFDLEGDRMANLAFDPKVVESERGVVYSERRSSVDNDNFGSRVWYPLLRHLGLKKRRPYQMRHTAATLWLASGEAPEWIARQLGHASTEMLFRVYSRYVPNLVRRDGTMFEMLVAGRFVAGEQPQLHGDVDARG